MKCLLLISILFISSVAISSPRKALIPEPPDSECRLTLSQTDIRYGNVSRWKMEKLADNKLTPGSREIVVTATCPESREMQFVMDGRGAGAFRYGEKGELKITLLEARLDGNEIALQRSGRIRQDGGLILPADIMPQDRLAPSSSRTGRMLQMRFRLTPTLPVFSSRERINHDIRLAIRLETR